MTNTPIDPRHEQWLGGQLLLLDKPLEWSSFDLVRKVRASLKYHLGIKKIKVGHAGTLDPLASGLMIICTGRATKKLVEFQDLDKEYLAKVRFGATTPSYDLETEVDKTYPFEHITEENLLSCFTAFTGPQMQIPPQFSAKRIEGKRAYEHARRGIKAELPAQAVVVNEIELITHQLPDITARISCSKGTYVRSLAHDWGQHLKTGAHLTGLIRTRIGPFKLEDAQSIKNFEKNLLEM